MEVRIVRLETLIPNLATKQDISHLKCGLSKLEVKISQLDRKIYQLEGRMHQAMSALGLRLVGWTTTVMFASFAGVFFIARYVH
ncbi:MAG: hypothetical protein CK528_10720 [Alcaligenaceae bacterium]|nr:MAG: hypothetical protein CK528_10720 [Alcaligenaceae bacterium]